jgi:hypothetical protein
MLCCWCQKKEVKAIEGSHGICDECLAKEIYKLMDSQEKINLLKVIARRYELIEKIQDREKKQNLYAALEQLILIIDSIINK